MTEVPATTVPVRLNLECPERLSRTWLFWKWMWAIPIYLELFFRAIWASTITFVAFWAILFIGRYPEGLFNRMRRYMAFLFRLYSYFPMLLTDHMEPDTSHPLQYEADAPKALSRSILVFLKLPSFLFDIVGNLVVWGLAVPALIAIPTWWVILFTGRYPRRLFKCNVALLQWAAGVMAWQWLMEDDFSLFGTTRPVQVAVCVGITASVTLVIAEAVTGFP